MGVTIRETISGNCSPRVLPSRYKLTSTLANVSQHFNTDVGTALGYGEPKIATDKLPIKSSRASTKWNEQQALLQGTKFSATRRFKAIEQQSKSRHDRQTTENLMKDASNGLIAEIRRTSPEHRHIFIDDLFKTPSAIMTPGLVLTEILDINRTLAMDQELFHHKTSLGGWTPKGDFDMSRPMWSTPEVRCSRFSFRMMGKIRESLQAKGGIPPRVLLDNPRTGNHGRSMKIRAAYETTLRIMLDPNTVNKNARLTRPRSFYFEYSERPAKPAEWER